MRRYGERPYNRYHRLYQRDEARMIARASALKAREIDRFTPANFWILRQYFENAPSINGCSNEEEEEEDGGGGEWTKTRNSRAGVFLSPCTNTKGDVGFFSGLTE